MADNFKIRFRLKDVQKSGEEKFLPHQNTFTFQVPNLDNPEIIPKLHGLLNDEKSLLFASVLLEMSREHEIVCPEGKYTLLEIQPHNSSKDSAQNSSSGPSCKTISELFTLKILINQNNKTHEYYIQTVMQLITHMEMGKDDVEVRITFAGIEKLSSVIVYFTLISLARICENWHFFISKSVEETFLHHFFVRL